MNKINDIVRELREDYPAVDVTTVVFSNDFAGIGCCVIPQDRVLAIIKSLEALGLAQVQMMPISQDAATIAQTAHVIINRLTEENERLRVAQAQSREYEAARANLREAWDALAMIRETVETLAPSGSVKAAEHLDGPTLMHEADALVAGIMAIASPVSSTPSEPAQAEKVPDSYRWRAPGNKHWIYDPTPEWIADHWHEIELEALFAYPVSSTSRGTIADLHDHSPPCDGQDDCPYPDCLVNGRCASVTSTLREGSNAKS